MALGRLGFFEGWNIILTLPFMVGVQFLDFGWEIIPQLWALVCYAFPIFFPL